jgi:unsaturated chondroitin disaccharide hydrolase
LTGIEQVLPKLYRNALLYQGLLPHPLGSVEGRYATLQPGHWTDGFWPATLLLGYSYGKDPILRDEFSRYMPMLAERVANDPEINQLKGYLALDHDVGFIFHLTSVYYDLLRKDEDSAAIGLKAAESLLARFNEAGSFLKAWNDWEWDTPESRADKQGKMIIDSLMNVPLLFWAYRRTGKVEFQKVAVRHIETVQNYIVRSDGSTYHTFDFNPQTGEPIKGRTGQGYHDESCWSRGQAWAVYGFALAFRYTDREDFRDTAIRCMEYWYASLLPSGDAPWDFQAPRDAQLPIDTSSMSITACGMLELWKLTGEQRFKDMAISVLERLEEVHLAPAFPQSEALLLHGSVGPAYHRGSEEERTLTYRYADQSLIYGDYFYLEALLRLHHPEAVLPWDF